MPLGTASAIMLGGSLLGQGAAGIMGANAAEDAAMAQLAERRRTQKMAMKAAEPSAQELMLIQKQIETADRAIARQEKLLEAVDPALMEAGTQALKLLRGQEASVLSPLRTQRARQRRELESRLREQLGPGFETSSAGQEALNRFDSETSAVLEGAQQNVLGQLLGTATNARSLSGAGLASVAAAGAPLGSINAIKSRQIQAIIGTDASAMAGAPFTAEMGTAQMLGDMFGGLGGMIGQAEGMRQFGEALRGTGSTGLPGMPNLNTSFTMPSGPLFGGSTGMETLSAANSGLPSMGVRRSAGTSLGLRPLGG